ncbi:MAG: ABC transporter ATP-binding protein [Gemmatimonadetes bacterium]|nr:ABC transporter ATP-binding protein [Gemmatimonadota bacterium]
MNIIEVHHLSKSFSIPSVRRESVRDHVFHMFRPRRYERLRVLDDVSFTVRRGETLGIMGRNGCGKSTLLKILCGIYHPDAGRTVVRAGLTPILELGIGWNPQLNAVDNAYLMGTVMGMSLREVREGLDEILAFAELERFANLELRHYSSGMASRLAYSIAFKATREILIIDEIFAVGDAGFRVRCEERYRQLSAAGHTVVIVSHEPRAIVDFCDRALLVEGGRIRKEGDPDRVASEYVSLLESEQSSGGVHPHPIAAGMD